MSQLYTISVWVVFFATTVYGHIGLKMGLDKMGAPLSGWQGWLELATSPWALSGILSWFVSSVVWIVLLSKQQLFAAHSISSLRYALVVIGAAVVLGESLQRSQWGGVCLIAVGVFLVARGS